MKNPKANGNAKHGGERNTQSDCIQMVLDKPIQRVKGTKEETITLRFVSGSNEQSNAAKKDWQKSHGPDCLDTLICVHRPTLNANLTDGEERGNEVPTGTFD